MDARVQRERDFHNERYTVDPRASASKYYSVCGSSLRAYENLIRANCSNANVLEYGCGPAGLACSIAERAKAVTGIDISDVAVSKATARAQRLGLSNVSFETMNAELLEFPDKTFDLIYGSGILHHLDLNAAFRQISRTLKPSGKAVFFEPLGHNWLINAYRRSTMQMRTVDEHPLVMSDIELSRRYFSFVDVKFYHLLTICAVPLRNTPMFLPIVAALDSLDRGLFACFPVLRRNAWIAVIMLSAPK